MVTCPPTLTNSTFVVINHKSSYSYNKHLIIMETNRTKLVWYDKRAYYVTES